MILYKSKYNKSKKYLKNMIKLGVHPVSAYLRAYLLIFLNISRIYSMYKFFK
jgi:hypothetical protein